MCSGAVPLSKKPKPGTNRCGLPAKEKNTKRFVTLKQARENRFHPDWIHYHPPVPKKQGVWNLVDYDLTELRPYIDWTPFFQSWQLTGKYPEILKDSIVGVEATKLFNDAQRMLDQMIAEKWITANAVVGLFPANSDMDDIIIYAPKSPKGDFIELTRVHHLRQQVAKASGQPNFCLSDFVAPVESGKMDYVRRICGDFRDWY
jgi:5-methyltetrahydrofolate--homocysteine methyltransferase